MSRLTIAHLYPGQLNIYGDTGNVIALRKRLEWRGYDVAVIAVEPGRPFDFSRADIAFGGGGQDTGQLRIAADLRSRGADLRAAVLDGLPLLAVCGLYQLLCDGFTTRFGKEIEGVGVFGAETRGSSKRMTGRIVVASPFGELVGFENHSGQTVLHAGQQPLGRVLKGFGNNSERRLEGALSHNAIGTYLHGPVLPNNPALADHLILMALRRRHLADELTALDDRIGPAAGDVRLMT